MKFNQTLSPTPFGFYDADPILQNDADKVVNFVLRSLGSDVLSVEISKKSIYSNFERATFTFNAQINAYQAKSNLTSLLGTPTGSVDPNSANTAKLSVNLSNQYIQPNLEFLIKQAEPYAAEIGHGQSENTYSGSIRMVSGQQDYDLYTDLVDENGVPLVNYMPSGSQGRIRVVEVFHKAPIQYIFNSNLASNFVAAGLPVESYVPDTRFYILPIFEDVLRASMLKEAQRVRRSNYRYRISGRSIRIYPAPREQIDGVANRIWIRVRFPSTPSGGGILGTNITGSYIQEDSTLHDDTLFGVNSPANVPYGLINYNSLNPWAKNWIFEYTLALCTELLGRIRNKFKTVPIPGAELQLNGDDLIVQAREDKEKLLYSDAGLIAKLEDLTFEKLMEREAAKAESLQKQLSYTAFTPTVNISVR
jgi:hypothetical protein